MLDGAKLQNVFLFNPKEDAHFNTLPCVNYSPTCWLRTWPFSWHVHWLLLYVSVGLETEQGQLKWRVPVLSSVSQWFVQSTYWFSVWLHSDSARVNVSKARFHFLGLFCGKNLAISMVSGNVMWAKKNKSANALVSSISRNGVWTHSTQLNWWNGDEWNGLKPGWYTAHGTAMQTSLRFHDFWWLF